MKPFNSYREYNAWARAEKEDIIKDHLEDIYTVNLLLKASRTLDGSKALNDLLNVLRHSLRAVRATKVSRSQ